MRSGGSYYSQNDLRVHFGIGKAEKVELLEIRWPSGAVEKLENIKPNQLIVVKEGQGIVQTMTFPEAKSATPSKPNMTDWYASVVSAIASDSRFLTRLERRRDSE